MSIFTVMDGMRAEARTRKPAPGEGAAPEAAGPGRDEAYYAEAQRLAGTGSWAWDAEARAFTHWSPELYRLHGRDPLRGVPTWESVQRQIHPDDRPGFRQAMESAFREGKGWDLEYRLVLPDGRIRIIRSRARPMPGAPAEFVCSEMDITERRRSEDELRASESRYRTFVDHAADALMLHDNQDMGKILDMNRQACESLGYSREELLGKTAMEFDNWLTPSELWRIAERVNAGETFAFETRHRRKDGTDFPVEIHIRPFIQGERRLGISSARDITERKLAEKALGESHDLLRAVVEGTPDAIVVKDLACRYRMINSAGARELGRTAEEVIGKQDSDLFPPEAAAAIRARDLRILTSGATETFEESVSSPGGLRYYLTTKGAYRDRQGNVVGLIGIARDITDMKRLEAQLRQAQKMEALGRLAGGLSHDFNNLLMIITGYCQLLFNRLPAGEENRGPVAEVHKAAEKAINLTRQLLAFSRKQVLLPQVICLNPVLKDLVGMLRRLIGENVELRLDLDPELGLAKIDPGQFEQAVINLAVNAREAIAGTGRLTLETRNARIGEDGSVRPPDARPGEYVVLIVSDTGRGMDEAVQARIFEPFFTTKDAAGPTGRAGTGLGLAMVYGFVKQSGGHIEVESAPGRGASFRLYLPLTRETEAAPLPAAPQDYRIPSGNETLLLVEDEEALRTLIRLVLQSYGYAVLEARDGQEGLWVASQYAGRIHAVVTDMVMPRMGGRQLADRLAKLRPGIPVLFMSGYTDDPALQCGSGVFVPKPISPLALARKVRQILDGEKPER